MPTETHYLPGTHARGRWTRLDAANILKRYFLCQQSLIVSQAGWLAGIAPFEAKLTLPRFLWEDAMTAQALRERVFELRFPSRLLQIGADAPLVALFDEAIHASSAEAFMLSLAYVFKPALLAAYEQYIAQTDEIADGPTLRFLGLAVREKEAQIQQLTRFAEEMITVNPARRTEAEAWVDALNQRFTAMGGLTVDPPAPATKPLNLPGRRPFKLIEVPARDESFYLCRFYWPDMIDSDFGYGEGVRLQLRSAISHLNEVWAVETAGAILQAFAEPLGWEFIYEAARWTYDESRHCRMGLERLQQWGFERREMPLGTYIYDSARGQDPIYRLGMLYYFETKNIGKKPQRAQAFATYNDHVSQHDMDFDWADEAMHAHFGRRWLQALHNLQPETTPSPDAIRPYCDELVATVIVSAAEAERREIRQAAEAMIEKASVLIGTLPKQQR